jgi:hypothetical protein
MKGLGASPKVDKGAVTKAKHCPASLPLSIWDKLLTEKGGKGPELKVFSDREAN